MNEHHKGMTRYPGAELPVVLYSPGKEAIDLVIEYCVKAVCQTRKLTASEKIMLWFLNLLLYFKG